MYQVGIDIGSSTAKTVVMEQGKIVSYFLCNTGFSSRETAAEIYRELEAGGISK
jgi:activator of 2-hydroxyglutaryl-CoA dehydratase